MQNYDVAGSFGSLDVTMRSVLIIIAVLGLLIVAFSLLGQMNAFYEQRSAELEIERSLPSGSDSVIHQIQAVLFIPPAGVYWKAIRIFGVIVTASALLGLWLEKKRNRKLTPNPALEPTQ